MPANRLYYHLKPYLPWGFRMALRRMMARRKRKACQNVWPINEAAAQPPEGWSGWPDGKKFAFVLTHDVEGPEGLAKCRRLMQLEQELGFRSSFNFIPEGDYAVSRELREELAQNGFEVGVHDLHHDGKLYWTRSDFSQNARWINHYLKEWGAKGFRSGFMLRRLDWLHELDIQYDASTFDTDPFEPQPDGASTIFPFWITCPESEIGSDCGLRASDLPAGSGSAFEPRPSAFDSRSGYVELPYTLPQDSSLFLVLRERSPEIWLQKLDWIAQRGGMALINVHPDYLRFPGDSSSSRTYPVEFYSSLLRHLRSRFDGLYWHTLPKGMAEFVTKARREDDFRNGKGRTRSGRVAFWQADDSHSARGVIPTGPLTDPQRFMERTGSPKSEPVTSTPSPESVLDRAAGVTDKKGPSTPARKSLAGKRVAVVLFSYYPSDPRPRRAAKVLAQEGAEIDFLCLRRDRAEPKREAADGLNIFRVPLKRRRGGRAGYVFQYLVFISAAFGFLARRSVRRRYDLVHVHNMPDILVFSALVPKLLGAKIILDLHDPMPELMETIFKLPQQSLAVRFLKWCEKWCIRFANLVLTPNIAFKSLFISRGCPQKKMHVLMNSPDEELFTFRPVASDQPAERHSDRPFTILYHGSLVARHGLDLAIDALEIAKKSIPDATIVICGENTSYFERVMDTVHQRGLNESVHYLGMRNLQQIVEAINQCDLGVIPNRRSVFTEINMPTRIFEYLALGKPVIAPHTQGIRDYFADENILFFEPDNAADLADKFVWAFRHPREMSEFVRRGQAVYLEHRWSSERERLVSLVAGLLGTPSHHDETRNSGKLDGSSLASGTGRLPAASEAIGEASRNGATVANKR